MSTRSDLPGSYDTWRTAGPDDNAPTRPCPVCRDDATWAGDWPDSGEMCGECHKQFWCPICSEYRDTRTGRCVEGVYCETHPASHLDDDLICTICDRLEGLAALQRECDRAYEAVQSVYERVCELVADVSADVPDPLIAGIDFSIITDAALMLRRLSDRAAEMERSLDAEVG